MSVIQGLLVHGVIPGWPGPGVIPGCLDHGVIQGRLGQEVIGYYSWSFGLGPGVKGPFKVVLVTGSFKVDEVKGQFMVGLVTVTITITNEVNVVL